MRETTLAGKPQTAEGSKDASSLVKFPSLDMKTFSSFKSIIYTVLPVVLPMMKGPISDATNVALGWVQQGINATVQLAKGGIESTVKHIS